jgi:hypothetical protein
MPISEDSTSEVDKHEKHEFKWGLESQVSDTVTIYESQVNRDEGDVDTYVSNPDKYLKDGAAKPSEDGKTLWYSAKEIAKDLAFADLEETKISDYNTFGIVFPHINEDVYTEEPEYEESMNEEETLRSIAKNRDKYNEDEEGVKAAVKADIHAEEIKDWIEFKLDKNQNVASKEIDGEKVYQHKDNI